MNRLRAFLVIVLCLLFCVSAHAELIMVNSPDAMPETDADGFLPAAGDGYYYSNHAEGLWLYMDADTRIEITRHQTKSTISRTLSAVPGPPCTPAPGTKKSPGEPTGFLRKSHSVTTPSLP